MFAGEYGAEVSTLLTANSQVLHTSFYDGDLEAFLYQEQARTLDKRMTIIVTAGETAIWRTIIGTRGANGPLGPDSELNRWFQKIYFDRYNVPPTYPAYQMAMSLLGLITGHLRPTKGTIHFEERDITGLPPRKIKRMGISRSFQVAQIFGSLSVFENMCAAAAIGRAPRNFMGHVLTRLRSRGSVAEAETLIELFEITRHRSMIAANLPQGVRKLLDIGMAVAGSPRLLLLDEPTSGISSRLARSEGTFHWGLRSVTSVSDCSPPATAAFGVREVKALGSACLDTDGIMIAGGAIHAAQSAIRDWRRLAVTLVGQRDLLAGKLAARVRYGVG